VEAEETVRTPDGRLPARDLFKKYMEVLERTENLKAALKESGLTWYQVADYRARCPEFDERCRRMQTVFAYKCEAVLYEQILDGEEPDRKLLMFALEHLHPDFKTAKAGRPGRKGARLSPVEVPGGDDMAGLKKIYDKFAGAACGGEAIGWRARQLN
jgi:hypothetical protein